MSFQSEHACDPALARTAIEERFVQVGQGLLKTQLHKAYQALALSVKYGLNRYPAIIFDGQIANLEMTALVLATSRYRQWLKSQKADYRD